MVAPKPAPARKREAARNAILSATSQLIAEKGIEGFTISDAARRAGINRALIYHYFHDRRTLLADAIDHVLQHYDAVRTGVGPGAVEPRLRMHIEHPELARFFFQMLLDGRPLPHLAPRIARGIEDLERFKLERAPGSPLDPTFAVIAYLLTGLSWAVAREELARLLGLRPEEADDRLIAQLRRAAGRDLEPLESRVEPALA